MKFHCSFFALLSSLVVFPATAQNAGADPMTATDYLDVQDYNRALSAFLELYKTNPTDLIINFNIGLCYVNVNDDRSKAIPYLEYVHDHDKTNVDVFFLLGKAYMYAYKFDQAEQYFTIFRSKTTSKHYAEVDRLVENCEAAKVLVKHPLNVTFENLGKDVNSPFPDYYPFISKDESTLYFTSRREGMSRKNISWQGYFTADVYYSKVVNGQWTKAKNAGPVINTPNDEECVYLSPDGKNMIVFMDNDEISGDLFLTSIVGKGKTFPKPVGFDNPINTDDLELEGCLADDGNMLIISSDRSGGLGETDLWMFRKLPNGNWGKPLNLGANVNTQYKEAFPYYDDATNTLYFASQGHTNMGGYDIFKSKYDPATQTFGPAENMGYPINTPEDNMEFTLAGNGRDGYVSAVRPGGFGDLDIYKVTFNGVDEQLSVIRGIISTSDSTGKDIDATVSLLDAKTKNVLDTKSANPKNGHYIFAVSPGKYELAVTSPGYSDFSQVVAVFDKSDYVFEIDRNVVLQKPGAVPPPGQKKIPPKKPPVQKGGIHQP